MTGVDASVELAKELDVLSETSKAAQQAPRSKALYAYLSRGMHSNCIPGPPRREFIDLTNKLIERLGIWWSPDAYKRLPVMVPWCIRDRSCRYDQGPESWGSPREDAYLRDDNSIIKKLPLTCRISGPLGHPFLGRKLWRGFTACHIWRNMPDGTLAGADPWLYSFMPNLIWLPTWLAPLTDRHDSEVQRVLQRTSIALFGGVRVPPRLRPYTRDAWELLRRPPGGLTLSTEAIAMFEPDDRFFLRRMRYLDKFVAGSESVLSGSGLTSKLICSRYTTGFPQLEASAIAAFGAAISDYREALEPGD